MRQAAKGEGRLEILGLNHLVVEQVSNGGHILLLGGIAAIFALASIAEGNSKAKKTKPQSKESISSLKAKLARAQKQLEQVKIQQEQRIKELSERADRAEEAVEYAEIQTAMHGHASRRFQSLFEGLPVGCMTFDASGTVFEWNKRASEIFGREPQFALLHPVHTVLGADDREDEVNEFIRRTIEEGELTNIDWSFSVLDHPRVATLAFFPLLEPNGSVVGGICSAVDVTDHRQAEAQIREMAELQSAVLSATEQAMITTSPDGTITGFNRAAQMMLRLSEKDVLGLNYLQIVDSCLVRERVGSKDPSFENLCKYHSKKKSVEKEWLYRRSDGSCFDAEVTMSPLHDGDGNTEGFLFVAKDITQEKILADRLKLLSLVARESNNGIIIADRTGKILFTNPAFVQLAGMGQEEIVGLDFMDCFKPCPECKDARKELKRALTKFESTNVEIKLLSQQSFKWLRLNLTPVFNPNYECTHFVAIADDTTARKESEQMLIASEQRFRDVVNASGEYIWETDTRLAFNYTSDQVLEVLGYTPDELNGLKSTCLLFPEDKDAIEEALANALLSGEPATNLLCRAVSKDGSTIWLRLNAVPVIDSNHMVRGFRGTGLDMTSQKEFEIALDSAHKRLHSILESIQDNFWALDADLNFAYVNRVAAELWDGKFAHAVGCAMTDLLDDPRWLDIIETAKEVQKSHKTTSFEWLDAPHQKWYEFRFYPSRDRGVSIFFQDITERKQLLKEIEEHNAFLSTLASTDGLTGLKNHKTFQEFLSEQMTLADQQGSDLAVILMDVDKFKLYNDTYGHVAGDDVLKCVARLLEGSIGEPHMVARYGGEEFICVILNQKPAQVMKLAEKARKALESADWPNREVTGSFGVSIYDKSVRSKQELIERADTALYHSKESGRNQVSQWKEEFAEAA